MDFWKFHETLMNQNDEEMAIRAIRSGLNVNENFWEDFISMIGNSDAVAVLLDIPKEKITGWASRIRQLLEKIQNMDSSSDKTKHKMINTGDIRIGK
jgi:DnaJ-domain-containing protein 1